MNLPIPSEASLRSTQELEAGHGQYSPSVPISVYRELAAELKSTKAVVDSLSAQNHQLSRQNQVLRQEFLQFAQSVEQLRQAVEATQPAGAQNPDLFRGEPSESASPPISEPSQGISGLAARATHMVKANADSLMSSNKNSLSPEPLFSEQRPDPSRHRKPSLNKQDMSGLWLATTILLIVVSAFGAGFLIMKPLLSGNR